MKRRLLMFLGIVVAIVLAFGLYVRLLLESTAQGYLPGMIDIESYHSDFGRDSVEYQKYIYKDTERLRKKLKNHRNFVSVTDDDIEYIISFFDDFESWVETEGFTSQYDFDKSCVDTGDYFYAENVETYGDHPDFKNNYRAYDVYYFDMQSMALYYIHIDI